MYKIVARELLISTFIQNLLWERAVSRLELLSRFLMLIDVVSVFLATKRDELVADSLILFAAKLGSSIGEAGFFKKPMRYLYFIRRDLKFTLKLCLPSFLQKLVKQKIVAKVLSFLAIDLVYLALFRENLGMAVLRDLVHLLFSIMLA